MDWRRTKVLELSSQGNNQSEISRILQISVATVNRDISLLRRQSKQNIRKYIDERLPEEYEKCLVGLTSILKEAWTTSQQAEDKREKIQALSLAKECYSMKLDLLTNATVVEDAIRFVATSDHHKEPKEVVVDSDDDNDDNIQQQRELNNENISKITKNQVF
jgi:hypothetical protein